ncbi:glutamate racemase [Terriglobus aquaticus]|uniref:Glutamate racemase n=1 Tax=Terriglobus aquaticus TaxID=940139 RepID=A0ABW9KHX0_9BACT|nr:glutamate racemase [Terriglobus aquaticus]
MARPCIGVFDSGFGGLTVLRALLQHLPGADFLYLGDTARLPYGSKSAETITRYTSAAIHTLVGHGAQLVVIACNTASALALPHLQGNSEVPLVGVIQPGAEAAKLAVRDIQLPVLVLATEATVASHAYQHACAQHGLSTIEKACPLLVPLVEEGWTDHPVTRQVAEIYLEESVAATRPGAVLLGCTHYPLVRPLLERSIHSLLGPIPVIDSAEATAMHIQGMLPAASHNSNAPSALRFFATDSPQKFQRLGQRFLAQEVDLVTLVDLDR